MKGAALLFVSLALAGCAKWPAGGGTPGEMRLIISMNMVGEINPNYVYFVVFHPSTDEVPTTQGPIPVIAPPWGNGFVAGTATHFMRWDTFQAPNYQIYTFQNPNLLEYFATGVPINAIDPQPGSHQLKFEIELSQIAGGTAPETLKSVQVNLLTMNVVPQGSTGDKVWDALGDGRIPSEINKNVTIPLRVGIYSNTSFQFPEPTGDVVDPALDIEDWQIEIRN